MNSLCRLNWFIKMETFCLWMFLLSTVVSVCRCDHVRLVGGGSNLEGRVEVLDNDIWGTVCDDLWGFYDAQVVCRQLGFPSAVRASTNAEFGDDAVGPILLDNVQCVGTETDILDCPRNEVGTHNCAHSEDAGAVCSNDFSLRLVNDRVNGTSENNTEGVVEVYYNGVWGTICDDEWSLSEARVVCNQLGFERAIKAVHESVFAEITTPILMDQVVCTGEEGYLSSCSFDGWGVHDCSHSEDAGVVCTHPIVYHGDAFDVRLVDGPSQSEGRLEVLHNGTWGTVCDDRFTIVNAQIVCKQLGYLGAVKVYPRAHYGSGSGPITLDNVQCRGSEQLLSECLHLKFYFTDCFHSEDVGVVCSNESTHIFPNVTVYITGGHEVFEGRVEVEINGTRGTVCHDYWDFLDAQVVCRQLGFPGALRATYSASFGMGTGPILLDNVECFGSETNLGQCDYWSIEEHNCAHEEDAGVVCLDKQPSVHVRLVAGSSSAEGRVELYYQGAWGTICDDNWDYNDAVVVCRELGFPGAVSALGSDAFGPGSSNQRILLDDVMCVGTETDLLSCPHDPIGVSDCVHIEDASVICDGHLIPPVRLVGGADLNEGVVQVYLNESWGTVCGDQWTIKEANVVCRQLGYSEAIRLSNIGEFVRVNGSVLLQNVYCTGFESYLTNCVHDEVGEITIPSCQNHTGDVGVVCGGTPIFAPVRLAGSENSYEGRVEIRYSGVWGTICDEEWDSADATVVCRMLGLSTEGARGIRRARFGEGMGQVWLSELECDGSEAELENCQRSQFGGHNCPHSKDASVICKLPLPEPVYPVRLYGSSVSYEGVVEVSLNGPVSEWLGVCGDQFEFFDAEVVCRQLGYPGVLRFYRKDIFNISNSPVLIAELGCVGDEYEVAECNVNVTEVESCNSTATIFCREYTTQNLLVRLVAGSVISEGQLQVFHQGYWGYVCDTGFGIEEAKVVCRHLGFPGAIRALLNSPFTSDSGRVWLSSLQCTGNESNVAECDQQNWGGNSCSSGHEVGVQCTAPANPIRLVGANSSTEGTVLIYRDNVWGIVCDDFWDIRDALVVCNQLGYPGVIEAVKRDKYGEGNSYEILLDNVMCNGTEVLLTNCIASEWGVHNCGAAEAAGVVCSTETKVPEQTMIRLVDGKNEFEGRVEILYEDIWGSVCDDLWSTSNTEVVCRQLGFEGPTETVSATTFRVGRGRIWLDNVVCVGTESDIGDCYRRPYGDHNCGHSEDVGVRCLVGVTRPTEETYDLRLVGVSSNRGRVEMYYHGHWGAICGVEWDFTDAEVVCNQLGYEGAIQAFRGDVFGGLEGTSLVWLDGVSCVGDETRLIDCTHGVFAPGTCMGSSVYGGDSTYNPVSVVCTDTPYNPIPIRLSESSKLSEGTVELFYYGIWGTVCDNSWSIEDAQVVCRSLGYEGALEAVSGTQSLGLTLLDNVQCDGTEFFIQNCPHLPWGVYADSCNASTSAGVVCNGSAIEVRLFGGVTPNIGVVQVKHEGVWGTICSNGWNYHSASVVCRQLGMGLAADYGTAGDTFTPRDSTIPIWLDDVLCNSGYESELQECIFDGWWIHYCTHEEDAYVNCSNIPEVVKGPDYTYTGLELKGGSTSYEGFVYVTLNGTQGTVCTPQIGDVWAFAKVICVQLNLEYLNVSFESRDSGLDVTTPVLITELFCEGTEQDINSCFELNRFKLCSHQRDLFVSCAPYPYCTPPTAQYPLTVTQLPSPTPIGSVAYFNCSIGFLTGPSQISCYSFQQWLPVGYPSCLPDSCSSQPDTCQSILARLVGGATSEAGNLQVLYNGTWGMVCDRHWTISDANVACKQMGFARAIIIPEYGEYGIQEESIWLSNVMCAGDESNILECSHDRLGSSPSCTREYGVSIICSDEGVPPLRLQGGVDESEGNIEIYSSYFEMWGHVCDSHFTTTEANVVCQQLGYSGAIRPAERGEFSSPDSSDLSFTLDCTGTEHFVTECPYEVHLDVGTPSCEKAGVVCRLTDLVAPVRLVGGSTEYKGRVEIWYQGAWGTVCGHFWGVEESDVVCRMLGFSDSGSLHYLLYQTSVRQIWLGDVDCDGDETELVLCRRGTFGEHYCGHDEDVGVVCQPLEREATLFVRLNGSGVAFEGNVEVSGDNATWVSVCGERWNHQSAAVVCRQLGYPGVVSLGMTHLFGKSEYPQLISSIECKGYEEFLEDCTNITYTSPVTCEGQASVVCNRFEPSEHYTRLFGGNSIRSGMLQVFYLGEWGAVCDSGWDERDARVVCRDLGFPGVVNPLHRYNVPYIGDDFPSWLSNLGCSGDEERLGSCRNDGWGHHSCTRDKFVGLNCEVEEFPIKLSTDGDSGYIQVYIEDQWGAICSYFWDLKESVIACRQLGYNTALETRFYPVPTNITAFVESILICQGDELLVTCWEHLYIATHCDLISADVPFHSQSVAGVNCTNEVITETNNVRLIPLSEDDKYEGYVEIQIGDTWFPICPVGSGISWNQQAAQVICRQLGYDGPAEVVYHNTFIEDTDNINQLYCNGTESNIAECNLSPTSSRCVYGFYYYFNHGTFAPAAVKCYAGVERPASETYDVRLTGGSSRAVGRVEVFYHGRWGVVCGRNWGYTDAVVVCKQLGFVSALQALSNDIFGSMERSSIVWLGNVACVGDEASLDKCNHDGWGVDRCNGISAAESADSSSGPASVICSDIPYNNFPISLKGSDTATEGRVEIHYQGQWGTICNKDWGLEEANVTCKSLGYEYALEAVTDGSVFGPGVGPQVLTSLHCLGNETFLQECSHSPWSVNNDQLDCGHHKDAAVRCQGHIYEIRLVGGEDGTSGFVEVQYFGIWGRVCNEGFNYPDAKVICQQIGLEYVLDINSGVNNETSSNVPIWLSGLSCYGTEGNIGQCEFVGWGIYHCSHQQDVHVSCTDAPVITNDIVTVRLLGDIETEGVVEVKIGDAPWGTVCTPSVGVSSIAQVICTTLGFPSLNAIGLERTSPYITNSIPISITDLSCVGTEASLKECYYMTSSGSTSLQCTHEQDLYVRCVVADHCTRLQTDPPLQVSEMNPNVPIGFIADFTCSEGWLLGASSMECSTSGVWGLVNGAGAAVFPTCSLITCSFIPDSNTYITNTSDTLFPVYTQINVSCDPGNTYPVTNAVTTVLICSANGWTPLPANCTESTPTTINPMLLPYSMESWAIGGSVGVLILLFLTIAIAVVLVVYYISRRKKRLRTLGFATLDDRVALDNIYDVLEDKSDTPLTPEGGLDNPAKEKLIPEDDVTCVL